MREIPIEISRVFSFKEKLQQLKGCDPDSDAIRDGSIGSCFTVKLSKRSNQDISRIVFRNFYTAKLRVEQQTPGALDSALLTNNINKV
jgi:hypothetical protein